MENKDGVIIRDGLELCIDHDHVTIPVARFEELLTAEIKLGIADHIYRTTDSYDLKDRLVLVFEPIPKNGDDNA